MKNGRKQKKTEGKRRKDRGKRRKKMNTGRKKEDGKKETGKNTEHSKRLQDALAGRALVGLTKSETDATINQNEYDGKGGYNNKAWIDKKKVKKKGISRLDIATIKMKD